MGNQQLSIELKKHAEGHREVFQRINVKLREIYPTCVIRQQFPGFSILDNFLKYWL